MEVEDLARWLGVQLDEDERIARAADADLSNLTGYVEIEYPEVTADETHALRHRPARVLREIDAKRRILAEHPLNGWVCDTCDNGEVDQVFPCPTLRLLALPYADRPGYREEWAP